MLSRNTSVLNEASKAKFKPHALVQILIFIGLLFFSSFITYLPVAISQAGMDADTMAGQGVRWWHNAVLGIGILIYIGYVKLIEGRSLHSMGFVRKGALRKYLTGAGIGIAMIAAVLAICLATGSLKYHGLVMTASAGAILLMLLGFMFQGMYEEVICRGYFMVSLANRAPIVWAIAINSVVFGALHLFNDNITVLSFVNLVLFGVFASVYFLRTDNIWAVSALHTVWNFMQGNVLGVEVSGIRMQETVFSFAPTEQTDIISGGNFGLEGGLAVTFVYIAAILITLFVKGKRAADDLNHNGANTTVGA